MLLNRLSAEVIIANLIALGIGMTVHEFAHNYVGHLMGDPVPAREGRLTLNPFVHINWLGWLMFAILGFGILGSAPISPYRMRNPRWGFLAAVAAGPLSNLALAVVVAIVFRFFPITLQSNIVGLIFQQTIFLNIILFLFNLIPLFPLDGWHIALSLLPPDLAYIWQRHQQTSYYLFIALLLLSFVGLPILGYVIGQPAFSLYRTLIGR